MPDEGRTVVVPILDRLFDSYDQGVHAGDDGAPWPLQLISQTEH
jgi:hypothetical protein